MERNVLCLPEVEVVDLVDESERENEEESTSNKSAENPNGENGRNYVSSQERSTNSQCPLVDQNDVPQPVRSLRRSQRSNEPPKRLQYPQLGNPLSMVTHSLLSGLSAAFTNSLEENLEHLNSSPTIVTVQPQMQRDLHV